VGPWALGRQPTGAAAHSSDSQSVSWQSSGSSSSILEEAEAAGSDRHQVDGAEWEQVEQQSGKFAGQEQQQRGPDVAHHQRMAAADAAGAAVGGGGLQGVAQQAQQQHSWQSRLRHRQRHQRRLIKSARS